MYLLINWYCSLLVFYLNMWMWNRGGMANPNQDETGWRQIFEVKAVRISAFTLVWHDNRKVSKGGWSWNDSYLPKNELISFNQQIQEWQLFPLYHVEIDFVYIFNVRMYINFRYVGLWGSSSINIRVCLVNKHFRTG